MEMNSLKKGQYLAVKAPPYYSKEYFYEVTSAGEKIIRAKLVGSSKVSKSWTKEEFLASINHHIIKLIDKNDM